MPKPKTRQQRRARERAPLKTRRRGSRTFLVGLLVLLLAGVGLIAVFRTSRPPLTRGAIAGEHWHASLRINICGKQLSAFPNVEGELHSHGDGFMHIHPQTPAASGDLASMGTFFATYQTSLTEDADGKRTLSFPDGTSYSDGDRCDGKGRRYDIVVTNKGEPVDGDPSAFLPHNGDAVVITFGPEETDGALPNPYATVNNIPDAGVPAEEGPAPEGGAPPSEEPQTTAGADPTQEPAASP